MPKLNISLDAEQAAFDAEVNEIKRWWESSAKQRQLKRYTGSIIPIVSSWEVLTPQQIVHTQPSASPHYAAPSNRRIRPATWR